MNNKSFKTFIFSTVGIIAVFFILIAVNIISSTAKARVDLTEEKLYTLSQGSKNILKKLDSPVTIRFYYSRNNNSMPVQFKNYAARIEDLLNEYKQVAGKNIILEKYNPEPDSDAEDTATLDGVSGQVLNTGEKIYLGISITCVDETESLPFLSPAKENLLEYDITRAITKVFNSDKPSVGIMSSFEVMGQKQNPMMMMQQGPQKKQKDPWLFVGELKKNFNVRKVEMQSSQITDIDLLIIIHPKGITDKTQFAIDQYILNGGKVIAFLDPASYVGMRQTPRNPMMRRPPENSSSLNKLLKAWGIEFDTSKIIADEVFSTRQKTQQESLTFPSVLSMRKQGFNQTDVVTSSLESMLLLHAGTFSGTPSKGLKKDVLLHSTTDSQIVNKQLAGNGAAIFRDFISSDKEHAIAIRLTGTFKTAFPDGQPKALASKDKKSKPVVTIENPLKEGLKATSVILVGDSDLLYDSFCIRVQNFLGQKMVFPLNDNLNFILNLAEQTSGDSDLIAIRCRQVANRPLEVINEKRTLAEKKYKDEIKKLEEELNNVNRKLSTLQSRKSKDQQFIISPEQQKEIKKAAEKKVEFRKKIKIVRKQLRKDIDQLQTRFKIFNIAFMPFLVTLSGISLAFYKRKRNGAK